MITYFPQNKLYFSGLKYSCINNLYMLKKMFFEWVILKLDDFLIFIWLPWVLVAACRIFVAAQQTPYRLGYPEACGISVPRPGIEPTSPALHSRFLSTGPPGKSLNDYWYSHIVLKWIKKKHIRWEGLPHPIYRPPFLFTRTPITFL